MKITFIGKYPPISGGESTKLYWLAKNLGERGHRCHIISDCQEKKGKAELTLDDLDYLQPKNVELYSTTQTNIWESEQSLKTERLTDLAIKSIGHRGSDIIVGWYLLPYGSAAALAAHYADRPYVLQHAGSDMKRLFGSTNLKTFLINLFDSANGIMAYPSYFDAFNQSHANVFFHNPKVDIKGFEKCPDFELPEEFKKKKLITFLGKISETKGAFDLLNAYITMGESNEYSLVYFGREKENLENIVSLKGLKNVHLFSNVPTWRVPGILRASHIFFAGERDFYVQKHFSRKVMEAMVCKTPVIISSEMKNKGVYKNLVDGEHCLEVDPRDTVVLVNKLKSLIDNRSLSEKLAKRGYEFAYNTNSDFDFYISEIETFLKKVSNIKT